MNRLSTRQRAQIIRLLTEGTSIRAVSRVQNVAKNTVMKLLVEAGKAAIQYHDENVRGIRGDRKIQIDEIWSFVYTKERRLAAAKAAPEGAGDVWTWTALDAESKLLVSWLVGPRDLLAANTLALDLRIRLEDDPQITTDGLRHYTEAIENAFGGSVDFTQLTKVYVKPQQHEDDDGNIMVGDVEAIYKIISGRPDEAHMSTSFVERQNLTMRMSIRRFTRDTNGHSKKFQNHVYAVALHVLHYNFCRVHMRLGTTPAVKAGMAAEPYPLEWIVELINAREPSRRRGPYRPRHNAQKSCISK